MLKIDYLTSSVYFLLRSILWRMLMLASFSYYKSAALLTNLNASRRRQVAKSILHTYTKMKCVIDINKIGLDEQN